MIKLSKRLLCIAKQVPVNSRIADIGSDHALLPTYLVQQGTVTFAVAGEVNAGPFEAAKKQVEQAGYSDRIFVRKGNGLRVLEPGEVDVVNIAGMGGSLMVQILSEGIDRLQQVKQLILQPNVGAEFVRQWLIQQGWFLTEEHIVEEDGHVYEILVAVQAANADQENKQLYQTSYLEHIEMNTALQLKMGPYLWRKAEPAFIHKWLGELDKLEYIIRNIERSQTAEADLKAKQYKSEAITIKEVITCLQKDRP